MIRCLQVALYFFGCHQKLFRCLIAILSSVVFRRCFIGLESLPWDVFWIRSVSNDCVCVFWCVLQSASLGFESFGVNSLLKVLLLLFWRCSIVIVSSSVLRCRVNWLDCFFGCLLKSFHWRWLRLCLQVGSRVVQFALNGFESIGVISMLFMSCIFACLLGYP